MKKGLSGKTVYREKYTPYPWTLEHARFRFDIGEDVTRVLSVLQFSRSDAAGPVTGIELDGQDMELVSVAMNGSIGQRMIPPNNLTLGRKASRALMSKVDIHVVVLK